MYMYMHYIVIIKYNNNKYIYTSTSLLHACDLKIPNSLNMYHIICTY